MTKIQLLRKEQALRSYARTADIKAALPFYQKLSQALDTSVRQTSKSTVTAETILWWEFKIGKAEADARRMAMKYEHLHR